ncbi:MAG TPA: chloride channel protein [Methylomirabilota bacterium]|nr:chloride channel protein [Methylomirabilota bacterium]
MGAVAFRALIAFFHNLFFLGQLSTVYDATVHTPASPWGPLVILVPVIGAAGVALLVTRFAPEAKGHGVPEVMDAIYYNEGRIRPIVALIKSLASGLSIGTGGAVGREGPIIQIGSSFGSTLAQVLRMPVWQAVTLIGAGAGAGIAATFNTPIGGVLFSVEIMLHEVSARTLVPVAIAVATATYVGQLFFGPHPSFVIPALEHLSFRVADPRILLSYVVLGAMTGVASAVYIRSVYAVEDFFDERVHRGYYVRHMLGMLLVGILMYGCLTELGHYHIEGIGYATIQDVLSGHAVDVGLLVLLCVLKLLATSLTLGSGASGGVFSPALYIGATLGGAYGAVLARLFPTLHASPPAFAVAGMAGLIGGSTGAAMAAIVMIFEMTLDYTVIVPMTITVALSYGVRTAMSPNSIYTLKLVRRGHYMPEALQTNFHQLRRAGELMDKALGSVQAATSLVDFARTAALEPTAWFLVKDGEAIVGLVSRGMALQGFGDPASHATVGEIALRRYATVTETTTLAEVASRLHGSGSVAALVVAGDQIVTARSVVGVISREHLGDVLSQASDLFGVP